MDTRRITRQNRHRRVRAKVSGDNKRPRLCVFRSNKYIYAQLINDQEGKTLFQVNDVKTDKKKGKTDSAYQVGQQIAKNALDKDIKEAVFDRGGYHYWGRVKAVAEGAREAGLKI